MTLHAQLPNPIMPTECCILPTPTIPAPHPHTHPIPSCRSCTSASALSSTSGRRRAGTTWQRSSR